VVTGDHYAANCPKQNKNNEQTMSITPYPGRNRSSSKERGGASKGSKNYRMLQGSFGSKPGSRAGAAAVAWSAAAAAAGSAAADEGNEAGTDSTAAQYGENNPKPWEGSTPHILDDNEAEDGIEDSEYVVEDGKTKIEKVQMVIDEAVKALVEMKLIQRKKEGNLEGYEEGSEYWLKFNNLKTEQDWKKNKRSMKPKQRVLLRLLTT
jgi:hypothetical protein